MESRSEQMPAGNVASICITLDHFFVVIGSTVLDWDEMEEMPSDRPAVWNDRHVLVAAEAQRKAVRVRLWTGAGPDLPSGHRIVFDGVLNLQDGRIHVGEPTGLRYLVCLVATPGATRVEVRVDDAELPTDIDVWVRAE